MTVDRLPETLREGSILSICDRVLGEVGRRSHMFGWLRVPGSGPAEWLAVDAYYPRARVVVMCRELPGPHEALCRRLVPARGLGLLTLDPAALGEDPGEIEAALTAQLAGFRAPPREAATEWNPVTVERTAIQPGVEQGLGVLVGMVLAVALFAEVYLAVVAVGLAAGRPFLGLAIALEACSRALGTAAAERAGERGWACACALGGAPVVAWFALTPPARRAEAEPAPLAGLLAALAGVMAVAGLLTGS